MSRQQYDSSTPESGSPKSSSRPSSAVESDQSRVHAHGPTPVSEHSSTPQSPQGVSSSSEGYPSWLPKRPPPPAPRSTLQSSVAGMFTEAGPSTEPTFPVGRKPTPRSVRIVSLQSASQADKDPRREPTDQSRAFSGPAHARVWSRATSAALTPTLFSAGGTEGQLPKPRFRSPALHLELLRNPSWKMHLFYYLFPVLVFAHIPLQTFFDFNAVFILLLVAKHPNPEAPGVPGSGRNWALGAAAYIACWFIWIFAVFVMYELVYSFIRRWRVKRPLILPLYFSSPAFSFAAMTSYVNFCFMYHVRFSAFFGEHGSLLDGLAETFYFYSQNLPTVALLMPRAALSLALLFAFSSPEPGAVALADAGIGRRDGTFFRASDETLTSYARGVLIANAAWTAWRILILLLSWIGLWIVSGQGCAGLCGPRYRWEEEDAEKTASMYHDNVSEFDALPWSWKECTILRIKDAYDFCLTTKPARAGSASGKEGHEKEPSAPVEGMERIFAAVGIPSTPHAARRGVLSEELFESPRHTPDVGEKAEAKAKSAPEPSSIVPPAPAVQQREKQVADPSGPLMRLPYPFTGYGAQISSEDVVPFPPSPAIDDKEVHGEKSEGTPHQGEEEEEGDDHGAVEDEEEEEEEEEEDEEEAEEEEEEEGEIPSSERRTSGSMSSLGRPVVSRYPFQFRRPRGSVSSSQISPQTHSTPYSTHSRSTQSRSTRHSRSTQSTGNIESTDSHSPRSNSSNASNAPSPLNSSFSGSVIPMPPRHPQVQRRARAGTIPTLPSSPGSPSPGVHHVARPRARTRTESMATESSTFGPIPIGSFESEEEYEHEESLMDVPEAEGSIEEAERQDSVGLLSAAPSPRASLVNLRHRGSGLSLHRRSNGSRSHSGPSRSASRSRTTSSTSRSESARSRAQSLIQSLGAASRSSIDLVRSRANSLVRLSDSPYASTSSEAVLSSPENHTFGHPLREQWRAEEASHGISDIAEAAVPLPPSQPGSGSESSQQELYTARSTISQAPSAQQSIVSVATERGGMPIAGRAQQPAHQESMADISTAPQSFITAPATVGSATSSSGRTQTTWGTMDHYTHGSDWRPM
ncbi:hypothetical protein BD414DRAFT_155356 [Trametes punicea]|nr:hypothetical protein BD414DRAFT_155356 [Trametes punicea]